MLRVLCVGGVGVQGVANLNICLKGMLLSKEVHLGGRGKPANNRSAQLALFLQHHTATAVKYGPNGKCSFQMIFGMQKTAPASVPVAAVKASDCSSINP